MSKKEETPIQGWKGFDKYFKCRGMQYEEGKTYSIPDDKKLKCCPYESNNEGGLHYCEHPLNVFDYYAPANSRFAEVEATGEVDKKGDDTKVAARRLTIKAEISFKAIIDAAVKFVFDRADWSKKETHTTGYRGAASATGDRGAASATGKDSTACALGPFSKATKGNYIVLSEWKQNPDYSVERLDMQVFLVDGKKVKADTFYTLKNGKPVIAD